MWCVNFEHAAKALINTRSLFYKFWQSPLMYCSNGGTRWHLNYYATNTYEAEEFEAFENFTIRDFLFICFFATAEFTPSRRVVRELHKNLICTPYTHIRARTQSSQCRVLTVNPSVAGFTSLSIRLSLL